MWGIFMVFEGMVPHGGGGFLTICFTHSSKSGNKVGIGLVPSFLTVISSTQSLVLLAGFFLFR